MKSFKTTIFLLFAFIFMHIYSFANTIHVGPNRTYKEPSAVVNIAKDGDTIAIDAGIYLSDVAAWRQNNLHFIGVNGMAHLKSQGKASQGKAIWVIKGNNNIIESIEFSECTVPDQNGAGIRMEGTNLIVRNCYFHDNENGILAGNNDKSEILVEYCEFGFNGHGRGFTHNIYINHVAKFTAQYNYFHHAKVGHQLKSRAHETYILYNRLMDEKSGNSSRLIDIPNGGFALVMGNLLMQGTNAENSNLVGYGLEGLNNPEPHNFYLYNNTFINERHASVFIQTRQGTISKIINNAFVGKGTVLKGVADEMHHNIMNEDKDAFKFIDYQNYDYHILKSSVLIDKGTHQITLPMNIALNKQYKHIANFEERIESGTKDIGAYEFKVSTFSNNHNINEFHIYPNPAKERLTLNVPIQTQLVAILDQFGRDMPIQWLMDNQLIIQNYSNGMYFLYFELNGEFIYKAFVKQ